LLVISFFVVVGLQFFDGHVFELAGLEDFAALFAFDVFGILVAGHDLDLRMFALLPRGWLAGLGRRTGRHKLSAQFSFEGMEATVFCRKMAVLWNRLAQKSSPRWELTEV
jgi:hypothetical protein